MAVRNVTQIFYVLLTLLIQLEFINGMCSVPANQWPLGEQCSPYWIPGNIGALERSLNEKLYGQHLVTETVVAAIKGHIQDPFPRHPLVLSFHGPTGTGKNHVSHIIAESLYRKGMNSQFVHQKVSTLHYQYRSHVGEYKREIEELISSNVKKCPQQLFIFDEVENMPAGVIDTFVPFVDYYKNIDGIDYRRSIFVFLSNIAAQAIKDYTESHFLTRNSRENIRLKTMEEIIAREAYIRDAGMKQSRLLDSHLVSHFIPFLPLEVRHVRECIKTELRLRGVYADKNIVRDVVDELQFYGPNKENKIFSLKGCKNVVEKVNLVLYMYREKLEL